MKLFIFLTLIFFCKSNGALASQFWFGKTMTPIAAESRWGKEEFNIDRFKQGDVVTRAKMASSLVRQKSKWLGKSRRDIRESLGGFSGFYFSELIPTYIISGGEIDSPETWQIVFLLNNDYKVSDIIIHKNCCGK